MMISNTRRTRFIPSAVVAGVICVLLALTGFTMPLAYGATSIEKQAEADALMQTLDAIQTELNAAVADYEQALDDHATATSAMQAAQQRIDETDVRIAELQGRLGDRAASMYKSGSLTFIDVLLGASSFDEFLTGWDMATRISSNDAALVQESKDLRQEALDARNAFELEQANAQKALDESNRLKGQIESNRNDMVEEIDKITAEVAELQAQEELQAEAARQAKEAAEREAQANPGTGGGSIVLPGNGMLGHPIPGAPITSGYGYRDFDGSFHQGIDYGAGTGTPFYAAESGTVTVADDAGTTTAGKWILISHGNGLTTRYLHASALDVSLYQQVTKGQRIGYVGSTGNSSGPHLHFGVMANNSYVNPLNYL